MASTKTRPPRGTEVIGRANAFIAARAAVAEHISMDVAAKKYGSNYSSVQEAMTIIRHGTAEECAAVEAGSSMRDMARLIRRRAPADVRKGRARKPTFAPEVQEGREFDAQVWGKLREALDALTSLPVTADVLAIVRKNAMRDEHVSRKLLTAHTWLEEFTNAYTG